MGKGAPLRWIENRVIARYLSGRGVEIGALWKKFPVSRSAKVWYVDRGKADYLEHHYREAGPHYVLPDVVADAARLPFADSSLHFIVASHLIEHMPNPLAVLHHWYNVLAPAGVLLLKIPDKRYTFDIKRERTPLEHLVAEYSNPGSFDKRAHYQDWAENVLNLPRGSEECEREVERLMAMDYSIHYHTWIKEDIWELIEYTRSGMQLDWKPAMFLGTRFYRRECAVVLQKGGHGLW